jgi:quercetin dioxygenase-like cupin family protein
MMNISESQNTTFPKGEKASPDYFTGSAWVNMLVPNNPAFNVTVANVVFEPGCRNNWHSHPGGQILICIDGEGYYQEKGKPMQLLRKGDVVEILPDIVHWHGATPYSALTHIAVNTNTQKGIVNWLERVTDEEYNSFR